MTDITFLDGGLGQEINNRSTQDSAHPLWSVKVMFEEPDIVIATHKDFIRAGARVITMNNYTATIPRMTRHGFGDQFHAAHQLAAELVNKAIHQAQTEFDQEIDVNIAGCLPPIAASYVASAALNYDDSYDQYSQLIEIQAQHVDVFLAETISNITEAKAALAALKAAGQKCFIGLTLSDDLSNSLRSGESLGNSTAPIPVHSSGRAVFPFIISAA